MATWQELSGEVPDGPLELLRVELADTVVVRSSDAKDHRLVGSRREGVGLTTVERR